MSKGKEIQKLLFDTIRQRVSQHISLVHEVAELLGISYDSAYRRLRGDKELSIGEIEILSNKYQVSIDALFNHNISDVLFRPIILKDQEDEFEEWLKIRVLEVQRLSGLDKTELIIVARDLPVFHYFDFPELAAFKFYFWKKMLTQRVNYHDKQFNISEIPYKYIDLGYRLLSLYNQLESVEIWCQDTFIRIMHQIEFCRASGFFLHKNDALLLYEKLETLIRHMQYQTEQGCKFHYGEKIAESNDENIKVFFNDVLLIDNVVFVMRNGIKTIFMTHNSLDIMVTTNPKFCNQVEHALRIIMKTGNHISGTSALDCNRFFSSIYSKLEELKKESVPDKSIVI